MIHVIEVETTGLRVAWDDVAGTLEVLQEADDRWSDPHAPAWIDLVPQAQAGKLPIVVELPERYVLRDPLHDPADMMRLLMGATGVVLRVPPALEGVEATSYERPRPRDGGVV